MRGKYRQQVVAYCMCASSVLNICTVFQKKVNHQTHGGNSIKS